MIRHPHRNGTGERIWSSITSLMITMLVSSSVVRGADILPADPSKLTRTLSYLEMESFLRGVAGKGSIEVETFGTSSKGRTLPVVHVKGAGPHAWRFLIYAQQHGDEPAGKDALLYLIRDLSRDPALLPAGVELWLVPSVNPDGGELHQRRNAAGADLNRDHMILEQPETQALHRLAQRVRPHVLVDCHEFDRERSALREKDWMAWSLITMDGFNNPLFDEGLRLEAARWVDEIGAALGKRGFAFNRYWVGGAPPDDEQRHSAPDLDSAIQGMALHGGISFIGESGLIGTAEPPERDLGDRVEAYRALFTELLRRPADRSAELAKVEAASLAPLPAFLPVNYLWANPAGTVSEFAVIERKTGNVIQVSTANMMTQVVVKRSVPRPASYAVPAPAATVFAGLLERHAIPYERLTSPRTLRAERCRLVRVEEEFDELHDRYEGLQLVKREAAAPITLEAGSLLVPLTGEAARRAVLVLEPAMVYGLYQYSTYRALVDAQGFCPVLRVLDP